MSRECAVLDLNTSKLDQCVSGDDPWQRCPALVIRPATHCPRHKAAVLRAVAALQQTPQHWPFPPWECGACGVQAISDAGTYYVTCNHHVALVPTGTGPLPEPRRRDHAWDSQRERFVYVGSSDPLPDLSTEP